MCSCIVPRGHYRFLGQRRVNSPLLPRLLSNGYIKRHLACLAKTYLRCLLSGWGSTPVWKKKKERGCLLSSLRSVKLLAARVPVWPLRVNFHFQTNIRIAPFGTRRGPRRQYVITFLKFYFPSLLLSSYLMTCKSHFALSNRTIKVGLIQKNNSLPKFDFALQPGGLFRLNWFQKFDFAFQPGDLFCRKMRLW